MRPNALIAINLLFDTLDKKNVQIYIEKVKKELMCPNSIGVKTLSPSDPVYRPNFDVNSSSNDFQSQGAANPYDGPEWV